MTRLSCVDKFGFDTQVPVQGRIGCESGFRASRKWTIDCPVGTP